MLVVYILLTFFLYFEVQCQDLLLPRQQNEHQEMIHCVIGILDKYFSERKELTYVSMTSDDHELVRAIHTSLQFNLISREATQRMFVWNSGYLVLCPDVDTFTEYFETLIREPLWNPYARFLIVVKALWDVELKQVFDVLLKLHINNALVVNGSDNFQLYTYNPFDGYACGRYYNKIINYGLCSKATNDLYPNKLFTGLQNCTFRGTLSHRPPFSIEPSKNEFKNKITGMEQDVMKIISKHNGFKVNSEFDNTISLTTVAPNMTVFGPMDILQNNKTDVMFGSIGLLSSRADAFSYVCGYHDYVDEFKFAVKKAEFVPIWKNFYLEFDISVWVLLMLSLIIYSAIMIYLLKTNDKGALILILLDNFLSHGREIRSPMRVKCVFIFWVWFAYIVNTFYQSSMVSLTTHPSKEYQVSNEHDMAKYKFRACINTIMATYIYNEPQDKERYNNNKLDDPNCESIHKAMLFITTRNKIYTIIPSYIISYNKQTLNDKWGNPLIYYFDIPLVKFLPCYFFYKGFPMIHKLFVDMLRMRENGLAEKNLQDQYFLRSLKFKFSQKEVESRFVMPWCVYIVGCIIATLCFFMEYNSTYFQKWFYCNIARNNQIAQSTF